MKCLQCHKTMHKASYCDLYCSYCTDCSGVSFTVSGLRSLVKDRETVNRLWAQAKYGNAPDGKLCLCCDRPMKKVSLDVPEKATLELDLCTRCQTVWFDAGELYGVPLKEKPEDVVESLPPAAREKLALAEVRDIEERSGAVVSQDEITYLKQVLSVFGVPVEVSAPPLFRLPWLTWLTVFLCTAAFIFSLWFGLGKTVEMFGFVPSEPWRFYGLTWICSALLHGGIMHLAGNMYFLLVFGDNTEDLLGKWRYLALILTSEIVGTLLFMLADKSGTVPCVGASGFISGIVAFYCTALPGVTLMIRIKWVWSLRLYAWGWFLVWAVGQVIGAVLSYGQSQSGGIAYLSHLGGAAVGGIAGIVWQLKNRYRVSRRNALGMPEAEVE